jgi:hypothetical protein
MVADDFSNEHGRARPLFPALNDLIESPASRAVAAALKKPLPPVEQWNPPFGGDIDLKIGRDGVWFYQGEPIKRAALVRLFSTILRRDPERYVLVTPVECLGISVEDAPFIAVEMQATEEGSARILQFRTNVGDWVSVDAAHPLRFERGEGNGVKPYILVRGNLWALVKRSLLIDLIALGEIRAHDGCERFGVFSAGVFFPLANAAEIESIEANL